LGPIFLRNRSRRGFPHTSHQRSPSRDACHFFDPLLQFCYLAEIGQGPNSVNGTQRYPGGHHFCSAAHTTTSFPGHGDLQKKCSRGNPQRKLCMAGRDGSIYGSTSTPLGPPTVLLITLQRKLCQLLYISFPPKSRSQAVCRSRAHNKESCCKCGKALGVDTSINTG